jgi:CelD/BcsL family acetyltransferase involved in cellulose biosynthesis
MELVTSAPDATPFHHPAWATLLSDTYNYAAQALAVPGPNGLEAGIPVLDVRGRLRRRRYVSLPFTDMCPPLSRGGDITSLSNALVSAHTAGEIPSLELRAESPLHGGVHASAGVLHRLSLYSDLDRVFTQFHKSRVQNEIARAEREGVEIRRAEVSTDLTDIFYDLHVETRSRLGAPVQPRSYFRLLWQRMLDPGLGFLLLAYSAGRPIAGAIFLSWKHTVIYKYGASERQSLGLRPNHAILWNAIRWASENGYRTFDFGRSDRRNTGLRSFKSGWGATEEDLIYTHLGMDGTTSGSDKAQILEPLIKRSPKWVARALGELLYRYAA